MQFPKAPGFRAGASLWTAIAALALMILACTPGKAQTSVGHVRGRLLVKFGEGVSPSRKASLMASIGGREAGEIPQIGVKVVNLPNNASETAMAASLRRFSEVEYATVDTVWMPQATTPNDPNYAYQWHLRMMGCPTAWDTTTGSASVTIAVIDTGVDPILEIGPFLVPGWNTYSNNSNTADTYMHGTATTGVICATTNEAYGAAGIVWNSRIMPVRVSNDIGQATDSTIAAGITWAADHGARVACVSYPPVGGAVSSAASYFRSRGGIVLVPSGNEGYQLSIANDPNILVVGATRSDDTLAPFSSYGNCVDISAPGENITIPARTYGYTGTCSGTCASAAAAAGVAGLMLSANPNLSSNQLYQILQNSADDRGAAGWDNRFGWGRINAASAVAMAVAAPASDSIAPTVGFDSPSNGATLSGTATIQLNASDNIGVSSVSLYVDNVLYGTITAAPYTFTWNTAGVTNGSHSLRAVAMDSSGNSSSSTISVTVSNGAIGDTMAPIVTITSPTAGITVGRSLSVYVSATDNVGVAKVELYVDGAMVNSVTRSPFTTKWNSRYASAGAHIIQCKAYDRAGNWSWSQSLTVIK